MAGQRSLRSYLLVARPSEMWAKAMVVPLGYLTVRLLGETGGGVAVTTAMVAWLVFDLLLYDVRYELNDLADAEVDRAHVAAERRRRLPDDPRTRRWTVRVIVARLVVASMVIALLPSLARTAMIVAALGLVGVTVGYEAARTSMRCRPLADWREARLSARDLAVFGFVGGGYGLRAGLGAALAGVSWQVVVTIVVLGWAVGVLAVIMGWMGEAAVLRLGDSAEVLAGKSHLAVLARLIGDGGPVGLRRPLLVGAPARLTGCLLAGTSILAVVFAATLRDWPEPLALGLLLLVCAVVGPVLLAGWPSLLAGPAVMVIDGLAALALAGSTNRGVTAAVLVYVALAPAITRSLDVTSVGPGRVLAERDASGHALLEGQDVVAEVAADGQVLQRVDGG